MYGFLQPNHLVQYSDYLHQPLLCRHFNAFMDMSHHFFLLRRRRSPCPLFKPRSIDVIRLGIVHVSPPESLKQIENAKLTVIAKDLPLKTDSKKLSPKFIRPFEVLQIIDPNAGRLRLPPTLRIHPVFNVSAIKHVSSSLLLPLPLPPPPPRVIDDPPAFTIRHLLALAMVCNTWEGYGPEERCWVPLLGSFWIIHPSLGPSWNA